MTVHLWDAQQGAPTLPAGALGATTEYGVAFQVTQTTELSQLRWYRVQAGSANAPTTLRIWRADTSQVVYTAGSVPDNNAVGWQTHTLSPTVTLAPGIEYRVAACWPAGSKQPYFTTLPSPPSGLAWSSTVRRFNSGACAFPATTNANAEYEAVDVGVDITPGTIPQTPATYADLLNQLAAWLISTGDNTHQVDGLPWLIKGVVDAVAAELSTVHGVVDAVEDLVDGLPTPINTILSWGLSGTQADIDTILTWIALAESQLTGASAGGGSAFSALADQIASATSPLSPVQFPSTGWAQVADTTFDTSLAWAQAADLYVVTFTDLGSNIVNTVAAGIDVSYRLAWWTPLNGGFSRERRFIDFLDSHLEDGGRRMPGLLLHSPAGGTGTVQAWTYTP